MQKIKIDLEILLPTVPDERDACVKRLISIAERQKGIEQVHIVPENGDTKAQLCFHYDPDVISLDQIQKLAKQAGAAITDKYQHLLIEVEGIKELTQGASIEDALKRIPGVADASVSAAGIISLEFDKTQTSEKHIVKALKSQSVTVTSTRPVKGHDHKHTHAKDEKHDHDHGEADDDDGHNHGGATVGHSKWVEYRMVGLSLLMLLIGITADYFIKPAFFTGWVRFAWYAIAYLPVGWPVTAKGFRLLIKGDVFTEFALMSIATIGAFCIGEYPEGVTVMVFYTIGELFQDAAVTRAKRNIKALLDIRPSKAFVQRNGVFTEVTPQNVQIDEVIQIKAGEKVPLDGELLSDGSTFNTAALTGESNPTEMEKGKTVLAGMINQGKVIELKVTKLYNDSSLARILSLVQEAATRKAKTEQFIRKFSRIYTPIVVLLAVAITLIPYFFVADYIFRDWLYRALIFLVISCTCALVISIPLGYFGGIGAASRNGILFKGSNFLDLMTKVNTVVMDKTGTLTKGVFTVQEVKSFGVDEKEWLPLAAALEKTSTHPIAQAIVNHVGKAAEGATIDNLEEISGHGMKGKASGKEILAGNVKLMQKMGVTLPDELHTHIDTIVVVAIDKKLVGYVTIADEIKEDSKDAIRALHEKKIETIMLSGDKQAVVDKVAKELGIDKAYGDLLPEDKVKKLEEVKKDPAKVVAFVGDGINDAPVLALSDVGMAMGGLGSDAAIETADVIIQTDQPSRIARAIEIGRSTNRVVWQNIILAFVVKGVVMALGATGHATMWEAVFADVGVALLAILNAMRIQKMKFT